MFWNKTEDPETQKLVDAIVTSPYALWEDHSSADMGNFFTFDGISVSYIGRQFSILCGSIWFPVVEKKNRDDLREYFNLVRESDRRLAREKAVMVLRNTSWKEKS